MKILRSLIPATAALALLSCQSATTTPVPNADSNGDGTIDPYENQQYTRALEIAQSQTEGNIADANRDGRVDDLEYTNWQQRERILADPEQSGSGRGRGLDTAYKALGVVNILRSVSGF